MKVRKVKRISEREKVAPRNPAWRYLIIPRAKVTVFILERQSQEKDYIIFIQVYSPALIEAIALFVVTIFSNFSDRPLKSYCNFFVWISS